MQRLVTIYELRKVVIFLRKTSVGTNNEIPTVGHWLSSVTCWAQMFAVANTHTRCVNAHRGTAMVLLTNKRK